MQTHSYQRWWLRIATFLLAALAAASVAWWGLKLSNAAPGVPTLAPMALLGPAPTDPLAVARLLGGGRISQVAAPLEAASSRFKLTGVVADRHRGGYALISVDGKPAKPYRVGARVDEALVLHSLVPRSAALAASLDAPIAFHIEMPKKTDLPTFSQPQLQSQVQPQPQLPPKAEIFPETTQ